ncbi:hypothetical protein J6590_007493 [Homalodisca vitripennis]|nr:hypothetical protein J6590_007493 [Homalodisca vitripennis]
MVNQSKLSIQAFRGPKPQFSEWNSGPERRDKCRRPRVVGVGISQWLTKVRMLRKSEAGRLTQKAAVSGDRRVTTRVNRCACLHRGTHNNLCPEIDEEAGQVEKYEEDKMIRVMARTDRAPIDIFGDDGRLR